MLENPDFLLCCCWGHLFPIGANVLALSQSLDHCSWASWENILYTVCDEQNVNFLEFQNRGSVTGISLQFLRVSAIIPYTLSVT